MNNYQPRAPHPGRNAAEHLQHDSSRNVMQQIDDPERMTTQEFWLHVRSPELLPVTDITLEHGITPPEG
jgi:hypothetical protein